MILELRKFILDDIMIHQSKEMVIAWETSNEYGAIVNKLPTCYEIEFPLVDGVIVGKILDDMKEIRREMLTIENCIVEYPRYYRVIAGHMREHLFIKYVNCVFLNNDGRSNGKNVYENCCM